MRFGLAERRGTAKLAEWLGDSDNAITVEAGVRPGRLNAVGVATIRPIASNDNPEGRAENRRVDLTLELTAEGKPPR